MYTEEAAVLTNAADVPELLLLTQHVATQSVHYRLHLVILNLTHQRPETAKQKDNNRKICKTYKNSVAQHIFIYT